MTFKCAAIGDPSPVINWFRVNHTQDHPLGMQSNFRYEAEPSMSTGDVEPSVNASSESFVVVDSGTLHIINVLRHHSGEYQCEASSKLGLSQRLTATLRVLGMLKIKRCFFCKI